MAKQSKNIKAKITLRIAPLFLIFSRLTTDERFHLFDITYVLTHIIKLLYKFDLPRVILSVSQASQESPSLYLGTSRVLRTRSKCCSSKNG